MKKMTLLALTVVIITSLCGCETIKGLGRDIQNTGDNIWEGVTKK